MTRAARSARATFSVAGAAVGILVATAAPSDAADPPGDGWNCQKNVPPIGYEQEVAFFDARRSDRSDAVNEAIAEAQRKLLSRLCGSCREACYALEPHVTMWKIGSSFEDRCVAAVVRGVELEAWRRTNLQKVSDTDPRIEEAAKSLVASVPKKGRPPVVAVGELKDENIFGGARAEWLLALLKPALERSGATIREMPGLGPGTVPLGVDLFVEGTVHKTRGAQGPTLSVAWSGLVRRGAVTTAVPASLVDLPLCPAPPVLTEAKRLPESDPGLDFKMDARPSGSICLGETTQLWLTTDADLHVRVFDLYGDEEALLVFPNEAVPLGRVPKGERTPLGGPRGFVAFPVPGHDAERYVVLAAAGADSLGHLASWRGTCRVPKDLARALHRGEGFPRAARFASTSFRTIQGGSCPPPPAELDHANLLAELGSLPECGR